MNLVQRPALVLLAEALSMSACKRAEPVDPQKQLADPDPNVRATAASALRETAKHDAAALGDVGEAHWKAKLAAVPVDSLPRDVEHMLGVESHGSEGGGGGSTVHFELDAFWHVEAYFAEDATRTSRFRSFGPLVRQPRIVESTPPPGFSGRWTVYFLDGALASERDYASGKLTHQRDRFDDGQLRSDESYVAGVLEGPATTYYQNGTKATEGSYAAGKRVGKWVESFESGKPRLEATYVAGEVDGQELVWQESGAKARIDYAHGKETGQAAWDEHGALIYARGTTAPPDGGR